MHKEKSAFPQSPGIRARSDYIISAHTAEVNQYTTIFQELEHLQGWGLHITQHSGETNPGRFQGIDPRGGTELDENGPNLTEDVIFAIRTTLVEIEGPEEVQSSGIESRAGERSDIISSWRRAAVEHALAKANDGNTDRGPVLKVSKRADQSIVGLVLRSHGSPRTIGADGCSFVTKRVRDWVEQSANETEILTDSWINLAVAGLPSKRHNVIGRSRGSNTKVGEVARDKSKKFEVAPESMSADTGSGRPGSRREMRKETSECEVRAVLIWTESTIGSGALSTAIEVCLVTMQSRLHTCGDGPCVSFLTQSGVLRPPPRWSLQVHQ